MVRLDSDSVRAGDELTGTSDRLTAIGVDLVRVERCPAATIEFPVVSAVPARDGTFALTVPDDVPPTTLGQSCELSWRVRTRSDGEGERGYDYADVEVLA